MEDIIYFELNNWEEGVDYPDNDRFEDWFSDDLNIVFENDECGREADICGRDMDCYNCDMFYELAELAEAGEIDLRDPEKERKALEDLERMCGGHFILR